MTVVAQERYSLKAANGIAFAGVEGFSFTFG
jgi:hypothetical protein